MSTGPEKPTQSTTVRVCTMIFLAIGVVGFQVVARPIYFPRKPGDGFNTEEMLVAGLVGAASAVIGAGIGAFIDRLRKK